MKSLHLLIIISIPISFISGIGVALFSSSIYHEPIHVVTQFNNFTTNSDNGSSFVVVNPVTNRIYVANHINNTISVIDGNDNTKIASIKIGESLSKLAVNPNTNRIYAIEDHISKKEQNNTLFVIDGSSNTKIAEVYGPYSEVAINPNTNRIYAFSYKGDVISVIDGINNTKIAEVKDDKSPFGIDVNPVTNKIYVAHHNFDINSNKWQNGTVSVIDGKNNTKIASILVGVNPVGIGVNPVTNKIYVTNYMEGTVSVIDGINNKIIGNLIKLDPGVEGIAVNPLTNKIYAANGINTTLYVIDGNTGSKKAEIRVAGWSVAVNPSTDRIFVPDYFFNNISVIDGKYDDIMTVIPIGVYPN
jgi:YVTN family beta-propeller protein